MPKEISAGAVIFLKENKEIKYLLLHYEPGHWDFVKGNIEKGESEKDTVIREIEEETGIKDVRFIDGFRKNVHWFYRREGKNILKEVVFFLVETATKDVKISSEHVGFIWLNFKDAVEQITF